MYKALTIVAVIYGMFILGSEAIALIFSVGLAWPGLVAFAVVIVAGNVGALAFRALSMQPDIVASDDAAAT